MRGVVDSIQAVAVIYEREEGKFKKLNKVATVVGLKTMTEYEAGNVGRDQSCRVL